MMNEEKPRTESEIRQTLKDIAQHWAHPIRSPLLKTPADYELEFENVTFPSQDGVPLEAWFIPANGSDKLVICNHPMSFNRYGFPSHLEPWRSMGVLGGNDFEVDYVSDYRILHDAGYNVLTYDERNYGMSGSANGGLNSGGRFEARDVIGSLAYARSRDDLRTMSVGLFSKCNGCNATLFAMYTEPTELEDVKCLIACQPLSVGVVNARILHLLGLGDWLDQLDDEIFLAASIRFKDMRPPDWAVSVQVPTFVMQVKNDALTREDDVQAVYDNIPTDEKYLHWIENSSVRWDGYMEFQRRPQPILAWLAKHMN
ncbi:alpha/beta hydrolase family protein [Algihabitans albus]|uniref:alpha/beta hydrolase family protein n=1 Tax=Algihabitans albus TaxID=2164067 RepID=UPI001ABC23A6|nr:hypothetical protein [Algihabitans albus]